MSVGHVEIRSEHRRLRITRRGRVTVLVTVLVVLAGVWGTRAAAAGLGEPTAVEVYAVAPGDTVWELAARRAEPGQDVRNVVVQIMDLNNMRTADLRVGDSLVLPAQ